MTCINKNLKDNQRLINDFSETRVNQMFEKYFPDKNPSYQEFISHPGVVEDLKLLQPKQLNKIGIRYSKFITAENLEQLKSTINRLNKTVKDKTYKLFNIIKVGGSDFYTWGVRMIPGNIKIDEKLEKINSLLENQGLKEGLQWLKQIMPDVEPKLVDGLIDNIANGSYDIINDLITLSKDFANKNVVKEEASHRLFSMLPKEEQEKLLNEGSKKYGIRRGKSTATIKYSQADQNRVNFGLKAVEILQSDKAKQVFEKGEKNKWDLDRILTELQIPKEQKQLILDLGITDREEIISNTQVKPGVAELFESNPELAQSVYKALGFKQFKFESLSKYSNLSDSTLNKKEEAVAFLQSLDGKKLFSPSEMLSRISNADTSRINKGLSDYLNSILEQYQGIYAEESINPYRIEFKEYLKLGDDRDDTIGDLRGYNQAGYKAINLTNAESNNLIKTILHEFVHDIEPYVLFKESKLIKFTKTKGSNTPLTEEELKIGNQLENLRKLVIKHLAEEFKNKKPDSLKNEIERLENGGLITIYGEIKKPTLVYINNLKNELNAVNRLIETNKVEEFIENNKNIFLNSEYNHYGVTNLNEFITEALTNDKFRNLLNEIPYKNTTILSYLFELFQKILGIKKDTVLSEALNLIHELATTKREQLRDFQPTPQQKQQATFMFSEFLDVYLQDFEQVEKILKEEKVIDKKCS